MAKRRGTRRAPARVKTKRVAAGKATATIIRFDGRRLSRRIEFTPRMKENIRQRYVEAEDSPETISRSVGCAKATIQRLVEEEGWTRTAGGPRDLSRADQLAAEARALRQGALPPPERREVVGTFASGGTPSRTATPSDLPLSGRGEAETTGEAIDIEAEIERLLRLVSREIGVYENLRATLQNEPEPPRKALRTAHNLNSLIAALDDLRRMRAANKEPVHHAPDDDDFPADIDAFRDELARQIEAFMESRTDEECGLQPADRPGEETQT